MWLQSREKLEKEVRRLSAATFRVVSSNSLLKEPECGTAFVFFNRDARTYLLTCFHVVLSASSLVEVEKKIQQDKLGAGKDGYWNFYKKYLKNVQVENAILPDFQDARLEDFWPEKDLAILSTSSKKEFQEPVFDFSRPALGSRIAFCGFPITPGYSDKTKFPFTVNEGIISTFSNAKPNGQYEFEHLQLNAVNLGGNSGAALFLQKTCKILGIIDGHMINQIGITGIPVYDASGNITKGNLNLPPMIFSGVSYAIPIIDVRDFLEEFRKSSDPHASGRPAEDH